MYATLVPYQYTANCLPVRTRTMQRNTPQHKFWLPPVTPKVTASNACRGVYCSHMRMLQIFNPHALMLPVSMASQPQHLSMNRAFGAHCCLSTPSILRGLCRAVAIGCCRLGRVHWLRVLYNRAGAICASLMRAKGVCLLLVVMRLRWLHLRPWFRAGLALLLLLSEAGEHYQGNNDQNDNGRNATPDHCCRSSMFGQPRFRLVLGLRPV
mmetsp:Transcript_29098/g.74256  ORF Transcript_29098/g.74256 Transcript_29098/m.74256 type:complete len:210 (-) Transcript_29098:167-796(-)